VLAALLESGHEVPLVLTQPDRPAGRGLRPVASAVKQLALARGLQVFQPETLKDGAAHARIAAARADCLVVAAYGLILPQPVLELAPLGALNVHASLLPRWRGAAPIQRALLAGDTKTGISIMQMEAGLDAGPVLAQRELPIAPDDDAQSLHDKLAALGAEMIVAALKDAARGRSRAVVQLAAGVTYAHKISKAETVVDWKAPAAQIERAVRALRPTPGASTLLRDTALKLWRASVVDAQGTPGTVLDASAAEIVVACGDGALRVTELQRAGGKRLAASDFLHGQSIKPGERLG
jgi:methionyl-tRNA formyltransferase